MEQQHCRIVDIIKSEEANDDAAHETEDVNWFVPASATLEYKTNSALKKRRRIHQPLLACIEHVLKLSGLQTKEQ